MKKSIITACNNKNNHISSIYVYEYDENKPIRKYHYFMDKKIYCSNLITGEILKTTLRSIYNIPEITKYDDNIFGGNF